MCFGTVMYSLYLRVFCIHSAIFEKQNGRGGRGIFRTSLILWFVKPALKWSGVGRLFFLERILLWIILNII